MRKLTVFLTLTAVLLHSGCGLVSMVGSSKESEKKIPAEYDLSEHTDQKILVLVNQPSYLNAQANLRYHLTEAINRSLINKVEILHEKLVGYSELSEFRSSKSGFSRLCPAEVGKALDANIVLFVTVEDYQLIKMPEVDYYKGFLSAQAVLLDTASGARLWPKSAESKSVKVGFEVEPRGQQAAVARLAAACAHCTVRYLYNCPKKRFKIGDDRSGIGWESWER